MAQQEFHSPVPVLVAPREETVVDGRRVTFRWNPVDEAEQYRLQVSATPDFSALVYENTTRATQHVAEGAFPLNDSTLYWRVLVTGGDGRVHGADNIESFISGSPADEDLQITSPDEDEDFGPAARLFRGAAAEAAAEATHEPRYVDEESEIGVQHEGIEAGQIIGFILATAVVLGLTMFTLIEYVDIVAQRARAAATGMSGYPERTELELQATRSLTRYGVVDEEQGIYRIPIDRAIDLMAEETREQPAESYSSEVNLLPEDQ